MVEALVRDIKARQEEVRSLLAEDDGEVLSFVSSTSIADGVDLVASRVRHALSFDVSDFRSKTKPEDAFAYLRGKAERIGFFVLLMGNLGSHHTALSCEVFRGFAVSDSIAPFVVVNDQDAKAAWSFTLLHEIVHVFVGESGVSSSISADSSVERFCNQVASQILLPDEDLAGLSAAAGGSISELVRAIELFARPRNVSYSMVAFRMFSNGWMSEDVWHEVAQYFRTQWARHRASAREQARESSESGPSYYVVRRHKLGTSLLGLVRRKLEDGDLTPVRASRILGVKPRSVMPLVRSSDNSVYLESA